MKVNKQGIQLVKSFIFILFFSSCNNKNNKQDNINGEIYKTVIIDGCEYLQYNVYNGKAICHKGNCQNIIHK